MILKAILNRFRLRRDYIANAVDKIPPEIKDALVAWYSPVKQKLSNYDVIENNIVIENGYLSTYYQNTTKNIQNIIIKGTANPYINNYPLYGFFNLWRRTCRMISGEVVLPNTPTVTGYASYNPCDCRNNSAQTPAA